MNNIQLRNRFTIVLAALRTILSKVRYLQDNELKPVKPSGIMFKIKNKWLTLVYLLSILISIPTNVSLSMEIKSDTLNTFTHASKIQIKFLGYSELSGEYRVGDDRIISIPVLGRFSIDGISASDFEKLLSEKATDISNQRSYVSIEILEYLPMFVTGFVANPGSQEWRSGMTVIHAVTLSGGFFREQKNSTESTLLLATSESHFNALKRTTSQLEQTLAILARLKANESKADKVQVPQELINLVGSSEAIALINYQDSIRSREQEAFKSQISLYQSSLGEVETQITSLNRQRELIKKQLELRQIALKGISKLWSNKTVNQNRLVSEQMKVMEIQSKLSENVVDLSDARTRKLNLVRELARVKQFREQTTLSRIEVLEREASQLRIDRKEAQLSYNRMRDLISTPNFDENSIISFQIIRNVSGQVREISANKITKLLPGDILVVNKNKIDNVKPSIVHRNKLNSAR